MLKKIILKIKFINFISIFIMVVTPLIKIDIKSVQL